MNSDSENSRLLSSSAGYGRKEVKGKSGMLLIVAGTLIVGLTLGLAIGTVFRGPPKVSGPTQAPSIVVVDAQPNTESGATAFEPNNGGQSAPIFSQSILDELRAALASSTGQDFGGDGAKAAKASKGADARESERKCKGQAGRKNSCKGATSEKSCKKG